MAVMVLGPAHMSVKFTVSGDAPNRVVAKVAMFGVLGLPTNCRVVHCCSIFADGH